MDKILQRSCYQVREIPGTSAMSGHFQTYAKVFCTLYCPFLDKGSKSILIILRNPLGNLHENWAFLRVNHLPRPDRPRYPEYYVDCLRFLQDSWDVTKVPWNTKEVREEIFARNTQHQGHRMNGRGRAVGLMGMLATLWKPARRGIHLFHWFPARRSLPFHTFGPTRQPLPQSLSEPHHWRILWLLS